MMIRGLLVHLSSRKSDDLYKKSDDLSIENLKP